MNSRFVVKAGLLPVAAFAATACLQTASPVQADNIDMKPVGFGALMQVPLTCYVGGGGDVASSVRVINQTQGTIPAGKVVSWTVLKEGSRTAQKGSVMLKQSLAPQQSTYVGYTVILTDQVCTAKVKL